MSVRDDLIAAKKLIDTPEKLVQLSGGGKRQYTAFGAIQKIASDWDRLVAAGAALQAQIPEDCFTIRDFTNRPSTTHADVMALFDRAIAAQPVGEETRAQPAPDDFVLF